MASVILDEKAIFNVAREIPSPDARAEYLRQACGPDSSLCERIQVLLRAYEDQASFLESPPAIGVSQTIDQPWGETPGTVIGPYKLMEQIGEGGMGLVFVAEQQQPVRRKVALKVIKPGMDTRQVIARFEAERQALALMDHPNIARVLDGGETAGRRPYFVMELVKGALITEYCDQNQVSIRKRLELFLSICQAVQHAHLKGIIHRDLKPTNVLVASHDGVPVVKIIDFGVAKAVGQQLTEKTVYTQFSQLVGTPLYMSPEQAGLSALDVDTRSDVYSLGVLLYELLTGTTPFDKERLKQVDYDEMRRIIREEEPPKPSTRISTLGMAATTISIQRQSQPKQLSQLCRGELDWIVMKALEKDRNRRYESASAFAADVQRYLADEPVLACPPSAWYRFRKFARRRKVALLVTGLLCLVVVAGGTGFGWSAWDRAARRQRIADDLGQFIDQAARFYRNRQLPDALAEVELAQGLLDVGGGTAQMQAEVRQWRTDLAMAARLEELQLKWFRASAEDRVRVAADYARAFRQYGIDVESLQPAQAADQISVSQIKADLVPALEEWALRLPLEGDSESRVLCQRMQAVIHALDSDPWDRRCRTAAEAKDLRTLRSMVQEVNIHAAEPLSLAELGSALRLAGSLDDAVAFLRRAQRYHPADVTIFCKLIEFLDHLNPPPSDEIVSFSRALVAARPKSPAAYLGLALALRQQANESVACCREAVRLNPTYANAHFWLAEMLYWGQRHRRQGLAEYSRAVALQPDNAVFRTKRAAAYRALGNRDAALEDLNYIIETQPARATGWLGRGYLWLSMGETGKAVADYSQAIRAEPNSAPAWAGRGRARLRLRQWADAVADCTQALKLKPDYWLAYRTRADAYVGLRRWDKAIADFSRILQVTPHDSGVRLARAHAYQALGQMDKANADYAREPQRQKPKEK